MTITREDRFTRSHHCPICGGWDTLPQGKGKRCWGFLSQDGKRANCSRPEYAGTLPINPRTEAFGHRLDGPCKCGLPHNPISYTFFYPTDVHPASPHEHTQRKNGEGKGRIVKTYDYRDASGVLVHQTVRYEPKSFSQRRPDELAAGGWAWNLQGVKTVLYRLPELLALPPGSKVFVVEGEKDADNLVGLGLSATSSPMGAGKWQARYSEAIAGHHVVVIQDADDAGRKHGWQVATSAMRFAASIRLLELPGAKDASDWLASGGTTQQLLELVTSTPLFTPPVTAPSTNSQHDTLPSYGPPETVAEVDSWALRGARKHLMETQLLAQHEELGLRPGGKGKAQLLTFTSRLATQPTFADLEPRIAPWLETKSLKLTEQLRDCGKFKGKFCADHGLRQKPAPFNCRTGWEAGCLTRTGERLGAALIPDVKPEEGSYRILLFQNPYDLPHKIEDETPAQWASVAQTMMELEVTGFADTVAKVAHRKRFRGGLWARVFQQTLMRRGNYWWGWVVYEQKPGEATGEDLAEALLGLLPDAKLLFAGSTQSGDEIAMLLMLLTRSWLLDFDHDSFAFEGAVNAHAHNRMFQSYGGLQKALDEADAKEEEEKKGRAPFEKEAPYGRCEELVNGKKCGKALFQANVPPSQEHALKLGDKPGWALGRWAAAAAPPPKGAPVGTQGRF